MLAKEFVVIDADSALWSAARPILEAALRLEQNDDAYIWHGWRKRQLESFLKQLPAHCTIVVGVWDVEIDAQSQEQDRLGLGCICEVVAGEVRSMRTFEALKASYLPPLAALEPGYQHAQALMRAASEQIAPVAWALFTDRATWQDWLLAEGPAQQPIDKGELLAEFARQGRCVLLPQHP